MADDRETVKFNPEVARELEYGSDPNFEVVEDVLYDTSRWSTHHRLTIKRKSDGKFFQSTYRRGATEMQDERPFEYSEPVFKEVFRVEKITISYE